MLLNWCVCPPSATLNDGQRREHVVCHPSYRVVVGFYLLNNQLKNDCNENSRENNRGLVYLHADHFSRRFQNLKNPSTS